MFDKTVNICFQFIDSRLSSAEWISSVMYNGQNLIDIFRCSFLDEKKGMEGYRKEEKRRKDKSQE